MNDTFEIIKNALMGFANIMSKSEGAPTPSYHAENMTNCNNNTINISGTVTSSTINIHII